MILQTFQLKFHQFNDKMVVAHEDKSEKLFQFLDNIDLSVTDCFYKYKNTGT